MFQPELKSRFAALLLILLSWTWSPALGANVPQTISWEIRPQHHLILNQPYPLAATASSGLPVSLTVAHGPAVITSGHVTATNLGWIEVRAEQAGDATYQAAASVFQINRTEVVFSQLAHLPELTNAFDISLRGDGRLGLVTSGPDGVAVVDLGDPAAPTVRSWIRSTSEFAYSRRTKIVDELAYVLYSTLGLEIWNLQDSAEPVLVGKLAFGGPVYDLAVAGTRAFVVGEANVGLLVVDVSNPNAPAVVGRKSLVAAGASLAVAGHHLIVGDYDNQLSVFQADPGSLPELVGTLGMDATPVAIEVWESMAYCAVDGRGLVGVDISDPASPKVTKRLSNKPAKDIAVGMGVAWTAHPEGWVEAFDAHSTSPFITEGSHALPGRLPWTSLGQLGVAVHHDLVCVAGGSLGLLVVQTQRGMNPAQLTALPESLPLTSPPVSVAIELSSGLPAPAQLLSGPGILEGQTLHVTGAGSIHLRYEQPGNTQFLPWARDHFINVPKLSQTLVWAAPGTNISLRLNQAYPLTATTGSGETVQFRVVSGPAIIEDGLVRATNHGRIVLVAELAGDDRYLPVSVERTFNQPAAITTPVGRWPHHEFTNNVSAVAAYGQYALVGNHTGMQVMDLTRPADPVEVGSIGGGAVIGVEVMGQTAWLTFRRESWVVDLTDPRRPSFVSRLTPAVPGHFVAAVGVSGHSVYLAGDGFDVYDLSEPASPELRTSLDLPGYAYAVRVAGTHAFVASTSGLLVLDLTEPMAPNLVGAASGWNCRDVCVVGGRAFVAAGSSGIAVFDASNPTEPQLLGRLDTPGEAQDIRVVGNVAYVAAGSGLQVIDVSNPAAPKLRSTLDTPGLARGLTHVGNSLLIADGIAGIQIVNVETPDSPIRVGGFNLGTAYAVKLVEQTAYLANGASGLEILDITNPSMPRLIGKYDSNGTASDVEVIGSRAFLADGSAGLVVLDLTDPTMPTKIGEVDTSGNAWHLRVVDNRAYVADGTAGLQIIDVTNPAAPRLLGRYATQGNARRVEVNGEFVYVADIRQGLLLVRATNPASPTLVQRWQFPSLMAGVWLDNNTLYATDGSLLVRPPQSATLIHTRVSGGVDVVAHGNRAYTAAGDSGFRVIDVTEPRNVFLLGTFDLDAYAQSIRIAGDLAFVANDLAGLQIHRIREGVTQLLEFNPPMELPLSQPVLRLTSHTSSGLPVEFRLISGPATLAGDVLTTTNVGTIVVRAEQQGDSQFLPASAERTLTVSLGEQSISWGGLTNDVLKLNEPYPLQLGASSGLAVSLTLAGGPAYVRDGMLVVTNRGTVALAVEQPGGAGFAPVVSNRVFNLESVAFTKVGEWPPYPRNARDVVVTGQRAYLANAEGGMSVWDVSDPMTAKFLGAYQELSSLTAIAVTGSLACVADQSGLQILDVSDPALIRRVSGFPLSAFLLPQAIHLSGNLAYVITHGSMLFVLDLTNPAEPRELGRKFIPHMVWDADPHSIQTVGTLAYLAAGKGGLLVLDVSRPDQIVLVGQRDTPGEALELHVTSNLAYVADGSSLQIIDVSNPASPVVQSVVTITAGCKNIKTAGATAYLVNGWNHLHAFDLSNPAQAVALGQVELGFDVSDMELVEGLAFFASGSAGIGVMDVSNPIEMRHLSRFSPVGSVRQVEARGSTVYLADGHGGMRVLEVSNPSLPAELASLDFDYILSRIVIQENLALAATFVEGLHLLDISTPSQPTPSAVIAETAANLAVATEGDFIYLTEGPADLALFEISDPSSPRKISQLPLPVPARDIQVSDGVLYVVTDGGLQLVDWRNPDLPVLQGSLELSNAYRVEVTDDMALVSSANGLLVVDVSNPAAPELIGEFGGDAIFDTHRLGTRGLVAGWGLRAIDLTNPRHPVESGFHPTSGAMGDLAVSGDLVFVASGSKLEIFRQRVGRVQNIVFEPLGQVPLSVARLTLNAETDSGLPAVFTVTSGPGTVFGNELVLTGPGEIAIKAEQLGDAHFLPATPVNRIIAVTVEPQIRPETVQWLGPDQLAFRIAAHAGQHISVLASDDLAVWKEILSLIVPENDSPVTVPATAAHRYFRVQNK